MKAQLASLEARYTQRHPDVIRLKKKIADLETKQESAPKRVEVIPENTALIEAERGMLNQLREIDLQIQNLKAEAVQLNSQIKQYEALVENTPKREQELFSIQRDYRNMQEAYNSLLSRKLEADIAVSMEKKQKGEQFRILDVAQLPEKPISPNLKKLFILAIAAGLGVGGGLIFLFYYFDSSFRKTEDIETFLGLPVLATVPMAYQPREIKRRRIHLILSLFSIMICFALTACFAVLTFKGVDQTLAFIKKLI